MITQILILLLLALLTAGAVAPFGALSWWARQDPHTYETELRRIRTLAPGPPSDADPHPAWVVYLTGVGAVDRVPNVVGEAPTLDDLRAQLPGVGFVTDIYPYDVANRGLVHDRASAWFWNLLDRLGRTRLFGLVRVIVYLRNIWQFAVSADDRYGPIYAMAVAGVVWQQLLDEGYDPASRRPVVLFGWSGGAQIAVSVASYLAAAGMPVYVVALGGVITSDPGLAHITHLWQLTGTKDHVPWVGRLFPGRWPGRRRSYWARAMADGRITERTIGDQRHLGRGAYLSRAKSPDGRSYRQISVDEISAIVRGIAAERPLP